MSRCRSGDEIGWDLIEVERERDEARAEVARLTAQVEADQKRAAAIIQAVGAKWVEAFDSVKEDCAAIRTAAAGLDDEIKRLRAALAVFADRERWSDLMDGAWAVWDGEHAQPWLLAQAALEDSPAASANAAGPGPTGQIDSDHDPLCTVAAVNPPGISEIAGGCQIPAPPPRAPESHPSASVSGGEE